MPFLQGGSSHEPKLVKWRKLEEDPDAEKCQNCNTPGHHEEDCYFGANMRTAHRSGNQRKPKKRSTILINKLKDQ